jgi:hypothetical protein
MKKLLNYIRMLTNVVHKIALSLLRLWQLWEHLTKGPKKSRRRPHPVYGW